MGILDKDVFDNIAKIMKQAKELGIFTGERDILACDKCGLKEDVTFEGILITYFGEELEEDTGLRFIESEESEIFICPNCGNKVKETGIIFENV